MRDGGGAARLPRCPISSPAKRGRWRKGGFHDALRHLISVAQDVGGGYPQHAVAELLEVGVPTVVANYAIVLRVLGAVHLNHQAGRSAVEVGNVGADWMLSAKNGAFATQQP
jgi:hypothetical protein